MTTLLAIAATTFLGGNSGLSVGESITPFHPTHVAGPLAGGTDCFPCTFGNRPQAQVWITNDSPENTKGIASLLDGAMKKYGNSEFKAMIVWVAPKGQKSAYLKAARSFAQSEKQPVDFAVLEAGDEAVSKYKVNTSDKSVKNTVFVYKNWKVAAKMVNFDAKKDASAFNSAVAKIAG
jgi:hypothetical protein